MGRMRGRPLRGFERLLEVPDDVVDALDADREAYAFRADPCGAQLVVGELLVCRRRGVDDEGLRIADVGEVAEELQRLDQPSAGLAAAPDAERHDRSRSRR